MYNFSFTAYDELGNNYVFDKKKTENGILLTLKKENIKELSNICALESFTEATVGDSGYYLMPRTLHQTGDIITEFIPREDVVHNQVGPIMAYSGFKKGELCYLIRPERTYRLGYRLTVREGKYTLGITFGVGEDYIGEGETHPREDISIEIIPLGTDADYNDIAKREREIRLERGEIEPLSEKYKREAVKYAGSYPLVRLRCGWKPAPSPVEHQTPENEPPMHVACTFKRVRELADEFKRQGIEGAELQLVGWNRKGHDGRWPQMFPVEPELGGEEELIATGKHLKALGYRFSLHENAVDTYEIADCFSWDDVTKNKKGEYNKINVYSSGMAYNLCPTVQIKNVKERSPRILSLGVNGVHYIDEISLFQPWVCHNEKHPLHFKASLDKVNEVMKLAREIYGAFSSEGVADFSISNLDYGLYTTFGTTFSKTTVPVADKYVCAFEVTYHGIVLYNSISSTVNYPLKNPEDRLALIMRGGKPSIYFYSKFMSGGATNWMGEVDFTCDGEEDMRRSVALVKQACDDFKPLRHLQTAYIDRYDYPEEGIEVATYSNGTRLVGNFTPYEKSFEGRQIPPFDYLLFA